jgi:hypothetical protein
MFASKSLVQHLARGLVGIGAFIASVFWATSQPWLSVAALALALVALRGCPMCWTIGLWETVAARVRGKPTNESCADGSCAHVRPHFAPGEPLDEPLERVQ